MLTIGYKYIFDDREKSIKDKVLFDILSEIHICNRSTESTASTFLIPNLR